MPTISFQLSESNERLLAELATAAGMSMEEYVRDVLLDRIVTRANFEKAARESFKENDELYRRLANDHHE